MVIYSTSEVVQGDLDDFIFANDEDLYGFYQEIIQTFQDKKDEKAKKEVDEFLPLMSQKGSGDDISVSGIING